MNCHCFQNPSPLKTPPLSDASPPDARPDRPPGPPGSEPHAGTRAHARASTSARLVDCNIARTTRPTGRPIALAMTRGKDAGRPMGCRAGPAHSQQGSSSHIRHNLCQESQRKIYFYNRLIENSHVQRVYRSCTGKGGLQDHR